MSEFSNWGQMTTGRKGDLSLPDQPRGHTWYRVAEPRRRRQGNTWSANVRIDADTITDGHWQLEVQRNGDTGRPDGRWTWGPFETAESAKAFCEEWLAWRTSPATWRGGMNAPLEPTPRLAQSKSPDMEPTKSAVAATPTAPRGRGRPATGKRSNPDFEQVSIYFTKATHKKLKLYRLQADDPRDVSELVEDVMAEWLDTDQRAVAMRADEARIKQLASRCLALP